MLNDVNFYFLYTYNKMSWIDPSQYDPNDICPICHDNYGTTQAIYKTPCNHIFHNDCLYGYCEAQEGEIVCPVCRSDIEYTCMDVWGFKKNALGNPRGEPLFNGNQHILAIYNNEPPVQGGRRIKRKKSRRNKRTKRRVNKKRKTNRTRR